MDIPTPADREPRRATHRRDDGLDTAPTAAGVLDAYRRALARSTPMLGASFACVFLRDGEDPDLLRVACAHRWPQASARFLGEVRIRTGRGPTGWAVRKASPVEVDDIFADHARAEWWEPARELGFVAMTARPLMLNGQVAGAVSFYFSRPRTFDPQTRALLQEVADGLATTAVSAGPV